MDIFEARPYKLWIAAAKTFSIFIMGIWLSSIWLLMSTASNTLFSAPSCHTFAPSFYSFFWVLLSFPPIDVIADQEADNEKEQQQAREVIGSQEGMEKVTSWCSRGM